MVGTLILIETHHTLPSTHTSASCYFSVCAVSSVALGIISVVRFLHEPKSGEELVIARVIQVRIADLWHLFYQL